MSLEPHLSPLQIATLDAVSQRILPTGERPGARDANVLGYFEWLWDQPFFGRTREAMASGLDLLEATAQDLYGNGFTESTARQQDGALAKLKDVPHPIVRRFLHGLVQGTLAGFLCEPSYGGNRDFIGWKSLGFERRTAPARPR